MGSWRIFSKVVKVSSYKSVKGRAFYEKMAGTSGRLKVLPVQNHKFVSPLDKVKDSRPSSHKMRVEKFNATTQKRIGQAEGYISVSEMYKHVHEYKDGRRVKSAGAVLNPSLRPDSSSLEFKPRIRPIGFLRKGLLPKRKSPPVDFQGQNGRSHVLDRRLEEMVVRTKMAYTHAPSFLLEQSKREQTGNHANQAVSPITNNKAPSAVDSPCWPSIQEIHSMVPASQNGITNSVTIPDKGRCKSDHISHSDTKEKRQPVKLFIGPIIIPSHTNTYCRLCRRKIEAEEKPGFDIIHCRYTHASVETGALRRPSFNEEQNEKSSDNSVKFPRMKECDIQELLEPD